MRFMWSDCLVTVGSRALSVRPVALYLILNSAVAVENRLRMLNW